MKTFYLRLTLVVVLTGFFNLVKADHLLGMDMTYKCSGTNDSIFKITVTFYRDCRGCYLLGQSPKCGTSENCQSSFTVPTSLLLTNATTGANLGNISMSRTSISDATSLCKKDTSKCMQPCTGKYPYGIEKHVFEGTLDLRSQIIKGICKFRIATPSMCCRGNYITTGPASGGYYTFLEMDACTKTCNSSPRFSNDPTGIMCCNQPFFYNMGVTDIDNDSLSYSFVTAYSALTTTCQYYSPFSASYPIKAFFNVGQTPPYSNPSANPPVGLFLDKTNGNLILTPTDCSQVPVIVIQVDEWRKDSKGTYQKISTVRRDMTFMVSNCPNDIPPKITNSNFNYTVCEGNKLCFDINTEDKAYGSLPADTVDLTWNNAISGATFTIKDSTAREKSATFCWTPKPGTANDIPYTFTAKATSNNCPLLISAIRSFSVKVNKSSQADVKITKLGCNKYQVKSTPKSGIINPATYVWDLLDSTGNIASGSIAFFKPGVNKSIKSQDTLTIIMAGKYFLRHTISDSRNCPTVYYDTLIAPEILNVASILGKDSTVCPGTELDLKANVKTGVPAYKFQWYTPSKKATDTLSTLHIKTSNRDTTIRIEIKDANGCVGYDTIKILSFAEPKVNLGIDKELCQGDSTSLDAGIFPAYRWNTGSSTKNISVKTQGLFKVTVSDVNGCKGSDSISIKILQLPVVNLGNDISICMGDSVKLDAGIFASYKWNTGKTTQTIFVKTQGGYKVNVIDSKGCKGSDSIILTILSLPKPSLGNDTAICQGDSVKLDPGAFSTYKWNSGISTRSIYAKTQGLYIVSVTDSKGCKGIDSIKLSIWPLPNVNLGKDTTICIGDSIKLDAGIFSSYKWNTGATGRALMVKTQANYSVEVTNSNGCKNSDAILITFKKCNIEASFPALKNVKVYPNPAVDLLTIEFYNSGNGASITIQDLNGKLILKKDISSKGLVFEQINIKNFGRGYYIVDIKTDEGSFSGKVLLK